MHNFIDHDARIIPEAMNVIVHQSQLHIGKEHPASSELFRPFYKLVDIGLVRPQVIPAVPVLHTGS